jgi:hypothetical protein
VKDLEDVRRGSAQDASGCSREEEAAEAEVEVVEEVVVVVAAVTSGVVALVGLPAGVMPGVGMMVVKEGRTEGYDKKRRKVRENCKNKERKLNKRKHKKMRKHLPLPQNLKHNNHIAPKNNSLWAKFLRVIYNKEEPKGVNVSL